MFTQNSSNLQTNLNCSLAQKRNYLSALTIELETKNCWIIDLRASDHMTRCYNLFSTYTSCPGILKVRIVDGTLSSSAEKGTIIISDHLKLQSILHVPSLKCNLISISKLSQDIK
ncbi:hypothetical protein PanWU01x14_022010, partial [Parasponia andersonii]